MLLEAIWDGVSRDGPVSVLFSWRGYTIELEKPIRRVFLFKRCDGPNLQLQRFLNSVRKPIFFLFLFFWPDNFQRVKLKVSRDTFHFPWKRKFIFSIVRMVQGEAKTPKIMGCCRANFAFLPAPKIGTFRGKWTLEWMLKTSLFARLALYFFNQQ